MAKAGKRLGGAVTLALLALAGFAAPVGDLRLVEAVKQRDAKAVESLIREKMDINAAQPDGATALHWAAHWDDVTTAEWLIAGGANVNAANDYGVAPLFLACTNGSGAMAELLLKAGANANASLTTGETVLMACARAGGVQAVKALLERGAKVDAKDPQKGQTALMWAVAQKHAGVAQALVDRGADVHARSNGGFTPLLFVARTGDIDCAKVLLAAGANVNDAMPVSAKPTAVRSEYGEAPAASAAPAGTAPKPTAQPEGPTGSMTPLLMAAASGHEALAIFLLENGADPNAIDEGGATALHYTVLKGIASMNGVSLQNYVSYLFRPSMLELVTALLARGANPNARITKGVPVAGGRGEASAGATPFLLAAAASDAAVMRVLAENGANPLTATKGGLTPLIAAAGVGRIQDFNPAEEKAALEAVQLAVALGGDVNAANEAGRTALHGSANLGGNAIIEFLAGKGANLDARDRYQQTPLSIASGVHLPWTPKGEELGEVVRKSTAELLLKLGATPLNTPNYFTSMDEDSDVYRMNPRRSIPGVAIPQ
jgi:ankyrin repeat protein